MYDSMLLQMHSTHWNGWQFFPFFMMCMFVMFIFLFFFRGRTGWRPNGRREEDGRRTSESSLEILKRRFAKGEINKEQYEEMRKVLMD